MRSAINEDDIAQASDSNERALWRSVIAVALLDATAAGSSAAKKHDREQATHWLLHDGHDFKRVCSLAGLEWEAVRHSAEKKIAEHRTKEVEGVTEPRPPRGKKLDYNGLSMSLSRWATHIGVAQWVLHRLVRIKGMSIEEAWRNLYSRGVVDNFPHASSDRFLSTAQEISETEFS